MLPQDPPCPLEDPNLRPAEKCLPRPCSGRALSYHPISAVTISITRSIARSHLSSKYQLASKPGSNAAGFGRPASHTGHSRGSLQVTGTDYKSTFSSQPGGSPRTGALSPVPTSKQCSTHTCPRSVRGVLGNNEIQDTNQSLCLVKGSSWMRVPREGSESKEGRSASHPPIFPPVLGSVHLHPGPALTPTFQLAKPTATEICRLCLLA